MNHDSFEIVMERKKQEECIMGDFILCVAQYLIIMVALAGIGGCGAVVGIKLRKSKDAKK